MKAYSIVVAAAFAAVIGLSATPASAQLGGLLGGVGDTVDGLLGGGSDTGGTLGGVGDTVDGLLGGLGGDTGSGGVGVPGVATVDFSSGNDGTTANGTVLGGGGSGINIPLGSILGGNSGVGVDLPGFANVIGGGPGTPGAPGTPGLPGLPGTNGVNGSGGTGGVNGINGINGFAGINGARGLNGINGAAGISGSSRLQTLMRIMQNRAWLRFAQGNKLCLANFGVANVGAWVRPNEYGALQQLVAAYGSDIQALQKMMKNCRNGQNRAVDVSRVIGVDLRDDGQIVVMTI